MKKIIIASIAIIIFSGIIFFASSDEEQASSLKGARKIFVGEVEFSIEEVSTVEDMKKGLGGRDGICEKCGMLFIFPSSGKHAFWMKGMKFAIDIIWIDKGEVVYLKENVPHNYSQIILPPVSSDMVLEINAGAARKAGIKKGSSIVF